MATLGHKVSSFIIGVLYSFTLYFVQKVIN